MSLLRRTITKIEDGPMLDAFGRQRVSNPDTVFDSKTLFEKKSNVWDELLVNGATVSGGLKLASGYSSALANVVASELLSKIKLLANIAEVSDVITLSVYNLSNQIETFYGSLSWLEQQ